MVKRSKLKEYTRLRDDAKTSSGNHMRYLRRFLDMFNGNNSA